MQWTVLDTGKQSAEQNMQIDQKLLESLESHTQPILHLYDWQGDCATYGHFIEPAEFLNLEAVSRRKLNIAKRPTGGGIVFHNCDLAFSVLVPASHPAFSLNTLDNYALVNRKVIQAVDAFKGHFTSPALLPAEPQPLDEQARHFCMAKPTKYDVMIGKRKVGGAAQRRTRQGFLHQGTIAIALLPEEYLQDILRPGTRVLEAMQQNSFSLLGDKWTPEQLQETRQSLIQALIKSFTEPS